MTSEYEYIKLVVENDLLKEDGNILNVEPAKIRPGNLYVIDKLVLLCTCYEIDENNNALIYFFVKLEDKYIKQIAHKKIPTSVLSLLPTTTNKYTYSKMLQLN